MSFQRTLLALTAVAVLAWAQGCDRTINLVDDGSAGGSPVSCAECHDSSDLITGKQTQWAESAHGMGDAYLRGTRSSCAGCHSGSAFVEMLAAGENPGSIADGDPDPTRQDCRTCHMIHENFTFADFDLRTEAPVDLYAFDGVTFDGGQGNLCVNCYQPRRVIPDAVGGVISGITTHWGPHHGPQSAMLLGLGGGPGVSGAPSGHYGAAVNTCVTCHGGEEVNHTFEADEGACQRCQRHGLRLHGRADGGRQPRSRSRRSAADGRADRQEHRGRSSDGDAGAGGRGDRPVELAVRHA